VLYLALLSLISVSKLVYRFLVVNARVTEKVRLFSRSLSWISLNTNYFWLW